MGCDSKLPGPTELIFCADLQHAKRQSKPALCAGTQGSHKLLCGLRPASWQVLLSYQEQCFPCLDDAFVCAPISIITHPLAPVSDVFRTHMTKHRRAGANLQKNCKACSNCHFNCSDDLSRTGVEKQNCATITPIPGWQFCNMLSLGPTLELDQSGSISLLRVQGPLCGPALRKRGSNQNNVAS